MLARVLEVLELARAAGVRIFFMRHMSLPKKLAGVFQTRQMMFWQNMTSPDEVHPWFLRDSPGFALAPELAVRDDEAILDKITMSAFEGTPLSIALRDCGLQELRDLRHRDRDRHRADDPARRRPRLHPVLVEDACGAGEPEAGERAIAGMRFIGDAMICWSMSSPPDGGRCMRTRYPLSLAI